MKRTFGFWLSIGLALLCLAASTAWSVEIPLGLTLIPEGNYTNQLSITVTYLGFPNTQVTTAGGSFQAALYGSFDPSWNALIDGLGFVQKAAAPGDISFTDMSFFGGLMSVKNLKGDLTTDSPPRPVNPDGSFSTDWHTLILNGGVLSVLGSPTDLSESPLNLGLWGFTGSLLVSTPTIVGNLATYDVTLLLPVDFDDLEIPDMPGATISAHGSIRAVGSFEQVIPEPGTLALLAAGLLGIFVYARRRRK